MHALLPSKVVWAAVTGTATPIRALAMAKALGFAHGNYINACYSIDRPNLKYAHTGHDILDLSFLIPRGLTALDQIDSTLIFANKIDVGHRIMKYLDSVIHSMACPSMVYLSVPNASLACHQTSSYLGGFAFTFLHSESGLGLWVMW
ncbi:hypothetical protein BDZ97DRAFT_1834577 [Flammula alnicola]|nr:hypothetical protein BDZ97DRAFT_1834577 [Flammula alnicola]